MGNLPLTTKKVGDYSLSWKELKDKAETELRRIESETIALSYNMLPQAMEIIKQSLNAIVDSATQMIDKQFKKEVGMTLTEAKYKLDDGIQLFKRYKELGNSASEKIIDNKKNNDKASDKKQLSEKKAAIKKKLIKWLEAQTDEVYNAFFLVQAKEVIFEVKSITAQMADGGIDLIREVMESLNNLKKFFPGGGAFKRQPPKESVTLSIDYLDEDDGSARTMLSELAKSAKTEGGEEDISSVPLEKKGLCPTTKTILGLISSLLALLAPFFTLVYNYNTNKNGLKADGDIHSNEMLRGSAERLGLTDSVPYRNEPKKVNIANTDSKKKKRAELQALKEKTAQKKEAEKLQKSSDPMTADEKSGKGNEKSAQNGGETNNVENIDYGNLENLSINKNFSDTIDWNDEDTQNFDTEFMKFLNPTEDLDEQEIDMPNPKTEDGRKGMTSPSSDVMYVAPKGEGFGEEILFSEIDRVVAVLEESKEICKYNPLFPLTSISVKTDGGRVRNLPQAGNNKKELIEALLEINNGIRL